MLKRKHLLIFSAFLFLLGCAREEVVLNNEAPAQEDPISKAELDDFILSRLNETGEVFRWESMNDRQLWSAVVQADSLVSVGYKPAAEDDIRERMHEFDLEKTDWKEARQRIIDFVVTETSRLDLRRDYQAEDLLAFPENPYLPNLSLRVFHPEVIAGLRSMPEVRYVEPSGYYPGEVRERSNSGCSNDPDFNIAGDFTTVAPGAKVPWNFYDMNIPTAWNTSQGDNITISVIDTGSGDNQENLTGSEFTSGWSGGRFIDRASTLITGWWWWTSNEGPNDQCGHGTQMCGLATGPRDSDGNSVGAAYKANLLAIRAVSDVVISSSNETNGVRDAVVLSANRNDVRIMSMSIGTIFWNNTIADAIYYAYYSKGKMMFAAAGTSTSFTNWFGVVFPATMYETYAVTGVKEGLPLERCNTCHSGGAVDFVAVMQRRNDNSRTSLTLAMSGDQPSRVGGSSAATATTAGIAALVWATNPNMNRSQVLQRLQNASSIYPGRDGQYGWGLIDAAAAVN